MLRLVMETISIVGFAIASLYHSSDILSIPIAFTGLAWVVVVRYIPPAVDPMAMFWVTYGFLLYQLISFHDFNGCFLEECKTNELYSYIMLGSTGVFWGSMRESTPARIKLGASTKKVPQPTVEAVKPHAVRVKRETFPAVRIKVYEQEKPGPVRLKMGERLQAKWV